MQINKFRLFVAVLVLIAVAFLIVKFNGTITAKIIEEEKQQEFYNSWLPENCKCIEKNLTKCSPGFRLVGNICRNETRGVFTNVLKACSKYDCFGENYTLNQNNEKWEVGNK